MHSCVPVFRSIPHEHDKGHVLHLHKCKWATPKGAAHLHLWCLFEKVRTHFEQNPWLRTRGARSGSKPLRTPRLRGEANQCASDTLADSRVQKPKNFLAFLSRLLPPPHHREAEKEMERKFLVLLRRFRLQNEHLYYSICGSLALFISPSSRRPRRPRIRVWW